MWQVVARVDYDGQISGYAQRIGALGEVDVETQSQVDLLTGWSGAVQEGRVVQRGVPVASDLKVLELLVLSDQHIQFAC